MATVKEMIEKRAYELFIKRGGVHGYAMEDWQQAEKEILGELAVEKKTEQRQSAGPVVAGAAPVRPVSTGPATAEKPKPPEAKPPQKPPKKSKFR